MYIGCVPQASHAKETPLLAQTKLDFSRLNTKIYHVTKQVIAHKQHKLRMEDEELRALVTSTAIRHGLDYPDGEVERMIVVAVLAMVTEVSKDPKDAEAIRAEAIMAAWQSYNSMWDSRVIH